MEVVEREKVTGSSPVGLAQTKSRNWLCVNHFYSTRQQRIGQVIIEVHAFNKALDRFLFVDEDVYHIGASLKDLGRSGSLFLSCKT